MLNPIDSGENSSDDEGNEYVVEGGTKSNNYSFPLLYVDITLVKFQKINFNRLKDDLRKRKKIAQ